MTTLPFKDATCSRASVAWNPDTGASIRENVARFADGRIPRFKYKPKIYFTFDQRPEASGGEPFMHYDLANATGASQVPPTYLVGSGGREEEFELNFPEYTRLVLGMSNGSVTGSKEIVAYRLGPVTGKHFIVVGGVHGNENDGANGAFKAAEIIARHQDFQNFRDEWTFMFIPALNPDGWKNDLRNLEEVGPNGRTINLNRNFDWFWDEYVETGFESKGSAAESTAEAMALLNYTRTANGGGPIDHGALLDLHANQGVGARYQSRDRIWREITEGPGEGGEVPNSFLTAQLDHYIWHIHGAFATERVRKEGAVENYVRYFRSRFRPHLHSYFSSLGVFSVVIEEVKVDSAEFDRETYGSACNYRLDYILAMAAGITTDNWEFKDAVLIEKGTTNILNNADWASWQDAASGASSPEERPGFYTRSRADVERATVKDGEKFYNDGGEALRLVSQTDITLTTPIDFVDSCNDGDPVTGELASMVIVEPGTPGNVLSIPEDRFSAQALFPSGLSAHTTSFGVSVIYAGPKTVDILGGGTAPFTGASGLVTRIDTDLSGTPSETPLAPTGMPGLGIMHAGSDDNFLTFPAPGGEVGYLAGGMDSTGTHSAALYTWSPSTATLTTATSTLPAAVIGSLVVFNPNDSMVYIFGGLTSGSGPVDTIHRWDPIFDSITALSPGVVLPKPLSFMAGTFHPGTGLIYIYGGQEASGDMNPDIYAFDPVNLTIEAIEVIQNLDDDEHVEVDGEEGESWANPFGRWAASTIVDSPTAPGDIYIGGGRMTDTSGALSEEVYVHDVEEATIGLVRLSSFGYVRFSSPIRLEFSENEVVSEDFSSAPTNMTITNVSIGGGVATSSGAGLLQILTETEYTNEQLEASVRATGGTSIGDFAFVARAGFTGTTLDDGYRCSYDDATTTWEIFRVVSGVPTSVGSAVVGASEQINTTAKTVIFTVADRGPVHLVLTVDGTTVLDVFDLDTARITAKGLTAVEMNSATDDIEIDDLILRTSGQNEERLAATVMAKSTADNVSGYIRSTFFGKDDTGSNATFVTRRVRNYYTIPPANVYWWYRERLDLRDGNSRYAEDGFRYYVRIYKDEQKFFLDGIQVSKGSLLQSSYQHPDFPRADETLTWTDAININAFRLKLCFMATTGFVDLDEDLELARISVDASNYIRLVAKAGTATTRFQREYNVNDVHGPHDPRFALEKVAGGSVVATTEVICYWGYDLRDPSVERADDSIQFIITHFANRLFELDVDRYNNPGSGTSVTDLSAYSTPTASLTYNGNGYYGEPEIENTFQSGTGREFPAGRADLLARSQAVNRPQIFAGDRDPTGGQIVRDFPFLEGDGFDRGDSSTLGSAWEDAAIGPEYQTGAGWNIVSSQAVCTDTGFQRWDPRPQHTDLVISADVSIDTTGNIVGLLARWDTDLRNSALPLSGVTAYGAEVEETGASSAVVRAVRYHLGIKDVLATTALSAYTTGETLALSLDIEEDSLTATATGSGTGTAVATDTNYIKPKRVGIYGIAPAGTVTLDNFAVAKNFEDAVA